MAKTLTEKLGEFVAETKFSRLPARVVTHAKTCLLHNLGVALAGRRAERLVHGFVSRTYGAPRQATLFWDGSKVSVEGAALANAALMHARTQDDYHFPSSTHAGATVIPAALAIAESEKRTGKEFMTAVVLGYEIAGRVGREYDTLTNAKGFRPSSLYGVFGSAAASARLMRLPAPQISAALGFAANLAGGLGQTWIEGSSEWRFHVGIAARNGIFAARIAALNAAAARETLEGVAGFYRAFGGGIDNAQAAVKNLGRDWQILEVTHKPFPVCAMQQSPVQMMIDLACAHDIRPQQVKEITLHLSAPEASYPGINSYGPFADQGGTLMSGQYCMALALHDRKVTLDGLLRFNDPAIRKLSKLVRVVPDASLGALCSRLSVRTHEGRVHARETQFTSTTNKFSFEEDANVIRTLIPEMNISPDLVESLIAGVRNLEREPDLVQLLRCFRKVRAAAGAQARSTPRKPQKTYAQRSSSLPKSL